MAIKTLAEGLIVVDLPLDEPHIGDELKNVNTIVGDNSNCDVIIDFSKVEIITSSSISNLLILRNLLHESRRRLILCDLGVPTKCIFTVAGLNEVFEFADDRATALASLQTAGSHAPSP